MNEINRQIDESDVVRERERDGDKLLNNHNTVSPTHPWYERNQSDFNHGKNNRNQKHLKSISSEKNLISTYKLTLNFIDSDSPQRLQLIDLVAPKILLFVVPSFALIQYFAVLWESHLNGTFSEIRFISMQFVDEIIFVDDGRLFEVDRKRKKNLGMWKIY